MSAFFRWNTYSDLDGRRLKRLLIHSEFLLSFLRESSEWHCVVEGGVPEGAKLLGAQCSEQSNSIYLLLESAEFPLVEPLAEVPFLDVETRLIPTEVEREAKDE